MSDTTPPASEHRPEAAALRIIDAAANRASEGLRVVEDYVRFALGDVHLTALAKALRHDLQSALAGISPLELQRARDTAGDIGTQLTTTSEAHRDSLESVVAASLKRLQQSLRSLEEYGKLVSPTLAQQAEQMRYRTYTLERAISIAHHSRAQLAHARLYVLIEARKSPEQFAKLVEQLIAGEVGVIQLRDKHCDDRTLLARARQLADLTRDTPVLSVMNDRADLARLARLDGVHVGQEELSVSEARSIVGPGLLVGVSTHSLAQAERAVVDGADYIGVGPTFPSTTKSFDSFAGLDFVRQVARHISLPAFAIGGINQQNVHQVCQAGLRRVAVASAVTRATDIAAAARALQAVLEREDPPAADQPAATAND